MFEKYFKTLGWFRPFFAMLAQKILSFYFWLKIQIQRITTCFSFKSPDVRSSPQISNTRLTPTFVACAAETQGLLKGDSFYRFVRRHFASTTDTAATQND